MKTMKRPLAAALLGMAGVLFSASSFAALNEKQIAVMDAIKTEVKQDTLSYSLI